METVLIFFLVICILAYLPRIVFPWLLRLLAKRAQKQFNNLQNNATGNSSNSNTENAHHDKKVDKNIGEYVEYEEVNEGVK